MRAGRGRGEEGNEPDGLWEIRMSGFTVGVWEKKGKVLFWS